MSTCSGKRRSAPEPAECVRQRVRTPRCIAPVPQPMHLERGSSRRRGGKRAARDLLDNRRGEPHAPLAHRPPRHRSRSGGRRDPGGHLGPGGPEAPPPRRRGRPLRRRRQLGRGRALRRRARQGARARRAHARARLVRGLAAPRPPRGVVARRRDGPGGRHARPGGHRLLRPANRRDPHRVPRLRGRLQVQDLAPAARGRRPPQHLPPHRAVAVRRGEHFAYAAGRLPPARRRDELQAARPHGHRVLPRGSPAIRGRRHAQPAGRTIRASS
jgi:hypothetical protein